MHVWRLLSFGVHKPAGQPWITKWFHSGAASLCNYTIYRTFDGTQFSRPSWGPGKWSEGQHVVTVGPLALDWLVGCLTFVFCFSSLFKTQHTRKKWYPRSMSNTMIYEIKQLFFYLHATLLLVFTSTAPLTSQITKPGKHSTVKTNMRSLALAHTLKNHMVRRRT